jgi:hypothetical protein
MAGFLNALGWAAPVLSGVSNVQQDYQNQQQRAVSQQAFDKLIGDIPGYESLSEAVKAGMPAQDALAVLKGPVGDEMRQKYQTQQLQKIFQKPEDYRDPDKLRTASLQNLLPPEVQAKVWSTEEPKSEFERYITDVRGESLDAFRALPEKERDQALTDFEGITAKKGQQPIGPGSTGDPGMDAWLGVNPFARRLTAREAFAAYQKEHALSPQERDALDTANMTIPGLEKLKQVGMQVLPDKPGLGAWSAELGRYVRLKEGDPRIAQYETAKGPLIDYVRTIAHTTRMNVFELDKAIRGIDNANSAPALESAINDALENVRVIKLTLEARQKGPMGGDEATWSGTGFDGALNAATEGAGSGL